MKSSCQDNEKKCRYWCFAFKTLNIKIIKEKLQKQNNAVNKLVYKLSHCVIYITTNTSIKKNDKPVHKNPQTTLQEYSYMLTK